MKLCWSAIILVLAGGVSSGATTLISMDLSELVSDAATIAYGRVVDTRAVLVAGRTETVVTLDTAAFLKGDGGRFVYFRVPGGQVGRYRTVVVGAPVLREGDEVVAFLTDVGPQLPAIVGFSQGILRVYRESGDTSPAVLAPPSPRADRTERVVRGDGARRLVPLSAFVEEVRALAQVVPAERARRGPGAVTRGER